MSSSNSKSFISPANLLGFVMLSLKKWWIYALAAMLFGGLAAVFAIMSPPRQEVVAQLMLKDDVGSSSSMMLGEVARSFAIGDVFGGSSSTDNEVAVLQSHAVFLDVARDLGLNTSYLVSWHGLRWDAVYSGIPLNLVAQPGVADTISTKLEFALKRHDDGKFDIKVKKKRKVIAEAENVALPHNMATPYGNFVIDKTPAMADFENTGKFKIFFCSYDGAANSYAKVVDIFAPNRKTDFIDISMKSTDPVFAKKVVDKVIESYVTVSNLYKLDRAAQTLALVDGRLNTLSAELLDSESGLERFKKQNNLTDVEIDANFLMTKTGSLEANLLEAQTNFEVVKMTRDFISNPENSYSLIPEILSPASGDDRSNSQISQYNQLILERMQLQTSAKSNNSAIRQLDEQLDALRANIVTSVDRLYQNASVALRDLKNEDSKTKSRINELPTLERQYLILKRDNLLQEQLYLFLLQQREEINMNLASRSQPAQVIDPPYVLPEPAGLSRLVLMALGVMFGLFVAAVYVFFVLMRRSPVRLAGEVGGMLSAPVFQTVPASDGPLAVLSGGGEAESVRVLRSQVIAALDSCGGKVIAVTSMNRDEGRTYVSTNLAVSLAMIGKKVAIVDADMRNPGVAAALSVSDIPSLPGFVTSGNTDIGSAVTSATVGNGVRFDAVLSSRTDDAGDIVANGKFGSLVQYLKDTHDYVVIDSPCIKGYGDMEHITALADITLVVVRLSVSTPDDIGAVDKLYEDGRLKRMAVVIDSKK